MSWRTVVITRRAKLDLKTGYLVVRTENETKKIYLDEISVLMIEEPAVSITGCLISALNEKKIKVIFCDEKRTPCCELVSHNGSHDSSDKIRKQIVWDKKIKIELWTKIVSDKISKQAELLKEAQKDVESDLLMSYVGQVEEGDSSNREGHAAKVYFNALFGKGFSRNSDCITNAALNYGYGIILSTFNREIVAHGFLTQLGLFHDNMFNHFNLSCDLMEPFRILIDRRVYNARFTKFERDEKHFIVDTINQKVYIDDNEQYVSNAIKLYCRSVFDALEEKDISRLKLYSMGVKR